MKLGVWSDDQGILSEDQEVAKGSKPKNKAAIKAAIKKKKRANGDESDESDTFVPVKPKAKASKASPVKASPMKRSM